LFIYFWFFGSHYNSSAGSVMSRLQKCEITVSVCILEGTDSRASGFRGYFPQLLKLKELCCFSEAPLVVLKFELQFVRGDLGFPRE